MIAALRALLTEAEAYEENGTRFDKERNQAAREALAQLEKLLPEVEKSITQLSRYTASHNRWALQIADRLRRARGLTAGEQIDLTGGKR